MEQNVQKLPIVFLHHFYSVIDKKAKTLFSESKV